MSKIRVLAITPDNHGVGKYRIIDPFKHIGDNFIEDVHVDISFNVENTDEAFNNYDVVIFHSFIHQLPHEDNISRIKWLKSKGIIVIMDIDDFWSVDMKHPLYHRIIHEKIPEKKVELLKLADYITTTTPIFAKTIQDRLHVKNVHVFPNAVDPNEPQFKPKPTTSEKIRFGWLGGSSHLHDLNLMSNNIGSVIYNDKAQFVLCGFDTRGEVSEQNQETGEIKKRNILPKETVWYQYEKFFTDDYKALDTDYVTYLNKFIDDPSYDDKDKKYIRKWTQNISTYANNYNNFDISLAPLCETMFNSNKSQLKIIEAGFHKKAVIASDVEPFTLDLIHGENALLVSRNRNHKDWTKNMTKLIKNPELIKELGENLYQTVKDKYSLQKVCKDRVEFLKSIKKN